VRLEEEILRKIKAIAGVSGVAMISETPLDGGSNDPVYCGDQSQGEGGVPAIRRFKFISPGMSPLSEAGWSPAAI
jgi:hypothetical protein